MKREVLVSRLIARASTRYGVRVSDEIFGEWLRKKLIQSPPKRGRIREWNKRHYRIALEICRLNSEGVRIFGIIKWHLWLKGFSPPNFRPTAERIHLLKEFRRLRKSLMQSIYSTYDPRNGGAISENRANRIAKSMGTQDERLKSFLPLALAQIFGARNLIQFAVDDGTLANLLTSNVGSYIGQLTEIPDTVVVNKLASTVTDIGITSLSGLWGDPDEIEASGEQSIQVASADDFEFGRSSLAGTAIGISLLAKCDEAHRDGYQAATKSLTRAHWRISIFVGFLHLTVQCRIGYQTFASEINLA